MKNIINRGIEYWRSKRNKKLLKSPYSAKYAFVGVGNHALQNLYPVIQYLGIQLKYICCKSPDKLQLIENRFGVTATTSLDMILNDSEIKGIFVCTSPQRHYEICSRVISSGKYLFVEKPPCRTLQHLEALIKADEKQKCMVGMQKRYSPLTETLKRKLLKYSPASYTLLYHTGSYPEGEPFTDLFIHPTDLVSFLFGEVEKMTIQRTEKNGTITVQALLSHGNVKGYIELSTAYSWANPEEMVRVNTSSGEFRLEEMERLLYYPHPQKLGGIPIEKLGLFTTTEQVLTGRNNFNPLIGNNQIYTQGFFSEIKAFADMVEYSGKNASTLSSMCNTYKILKILDSSQINQA